MVSGLRLYNTLHKQEEDFVPQHGKEVTMYTCGPTVYGRAHIGNLSAFLMADLLRRWLETQGYTVKHVKNITDVGHLVRDRDEGEDKIEAQAKAEHGSVTHESVIAIARKYEQMYLDDENALNMLEPFARPRASEYVEQMKEMIEQLLEKGSAYITSDGIYFDVTTFPHYGALSGNTLENLSAGARIDVNEEKKHPADFALWKFCVGVNEHHALRWKSPTTHYTQLTTYPEGFPGWHIECSAMSRSLLGDTIDLHTGGEDNIFPHHECEIAQSESVTGKKPFVKLWLHRRRIDLEGEKMSKSLGNVLTIDSIREKGFSPLDLRYYLLSVHYRTNLKFSWKGLEDAKKARGKIVEWMEEMRGAEGTRGTEGTDVKTSVPSDTSDTSVTSSQCDPKQHTEFADLYTAFRDAMNSDLNTPAALAAVFELTAWSRRQKNICGDVLCDLDVAITVIKHTFGCFEHEAGDDIPDDALALARERDAARAKKDFAESDRLRDELVKRGFEVRDTAEGTKLKNL